MASLYGVCWKGVDNLLNRTLPAAGTSGSTRQVWGLLEQDSICGRLRRFISSCMTCIPNIYINQQISPLNIPYHAISEITVPTGTGDKLMPTQGRGFSRIPFWYACKAHEDDYHHNHIHFQ